MRNSLAALAVLAAIAVAACAQSAPSGGDQGVYLLVTRPMFVKAVGPLVEHRRAEGFRVVVSTAPVEVAIRSCPAEPAMILLVGDEQGDSGGGQPWHLPARRAGFYRWRAVQADDMPTDTLYGDLDGDGLPDIPVGRLPVRTAQQAAAMIAKIIAYESRPPTLDDLTIPVWAGTSDWGATADVLAAALLGGALNDSAPRWAQPWVIFGSASSPFCSWPSGQAEEFERQFCGGGAFVLLIGHGAREGFYSMEFQGRSVGYFAEEAGESLSRGKPAGPMVIIACYCGDFTGPADCLGEALVKAPAGPVAVIAATTESHPLPNYFSARAVAAAWGTGHRRLGELWLSAQQAAYRQQNPLIEAMLAEVEGTLEAKINTGRLRRDQLLLYAMLGDPATRLKLPQPLHGKLTREDGRWHWRVERPDDADTLYVSFRPAGRKLPPPSSLADQATAEQTHQAANAVYAFTPLATLAKDQPWEGVVDAPGTLRLVALGKNTIYATGLQLAPPPTASAPAR